MKCGHCGARGVGLGHVRGHMATDHLATPGPVDKVANMATVARPGPATEGMYRKGGQIYKVVRAVHGSGKLYARRLVKDEVASSGPITYAYVMAKGVVATLTQADRMDEDEARAFGQLTGICVRCATPLTDETSIARGMGPVCAKKI